ncbi:unnamed protein product [Dibothriocephalus latus]|uniref:Uncharacterized protein n=1 Tax=Dibothriocephalus latus TaxID=60516 RepID=A0A3P6SIL8_DIBLA|nr:unnamed protein product [Dibothriocephalus latus]
MSSPPHPAFLTLGTHKDLKTWTRAGFAFQRSKVQTYKKLLSATSSSLFLGCTRFLSTACHPATKGMVGFFHCQLKASLCTTGDPDNWTEHHSLVLLSIRSSLKPDLDGCDTELVFAPLSDLPKTFSDDAPDSAQSHHLQVLFRKKYLVTRSDVFLQSDRVRQPLEPPYEGHSWVVSEGLKIFRILRGTCEEVVSVNCLKVAVPKILPDKPCSSLSSFPLLPDPLSTHPICSIFHHDYYHRRLSLPRKVLIPQRKASLALRFLHKLLTMSATFTSLTV